MKDFDFDELDRAVNSVLAKKDTNPTQSDQAVTASVAPSEPAAAGQASTEPSTPPPVVPDPAVPTVAQTPGTPPSVEPAGDAAVTSADGSEPTHVDTDVDAAAPQEEDLPEVPSISDADTSDHATSGDDTASPAVHDDDAHNDVGMTSQAASDVTEDSHATEHEIMEAPEAELVKVDAIPHTRGRFMDVVPPANHTDTSAKPIAVHSGVNLVPSADFKVDELPDDDGAGEPATTSTMPNLADEEVEPSPTELATQSHEGVAESPQATEPSAADADMPHESTVSDESSSADDVSTTESNSGASTPFIPDVPVEKRPLNADASTGASQPADDPASAVSEASNLTSMPKEFDEKIMAVEANETIGNDAPKDEASSEAPSNVDTPAASAAPIAPEDKSGEQSHPVFDAGSYHQPLAPNAKHGVSKGMWFIIAGVLFLIGSVLGVLYFLYGQQ